MNPDISLIVTNYNYSVFLKKSIDSCLNQETSYDFDVIVVDDGSSDNSEEIIRSYEGKINYIFKQNSGVENSSNLGIRESKAKFVCRIDADDFLAYDFIEKSLNKLVSSKKSFCYSNYSAVNEKDIILWNSSLPSFDMNEIYSRGDFLATGTVYKKEDLYEVGLYNEHYKNSGLENFELILNFLKKGKKGILIEDNLFSYRIHSKNMSSNRREQIISYGKKLCASMEIGDYMTNSNHPYKLEL